MAVFRGIETVNMNRKSLVNTAVMLMAWKKRGLYNKCCGYDENQNYNIYFLHTKGHGKIMPQLTEWQNRPLEAVYPFIFMDAIHYKIRENHQIVTKAAYVVLGINLDGYKEILGIWIGESESSKFWLSVLNELKSGGIQDVYLFCVDGLNGFREAIGAVYPKAGIQHCIIHQIKASMRYVNYKHIKVFAADLKEIYTAVTEEVALEKLLRPAANFV